MQIRNTDTVLVIERLHAQYKTKTKITGCQSHIRVILQHAINLNRVKKYIV